MNIPKIIDIFLLFSIGIFLACEKDDICVDEDTPLLIIRFYDVENPEEFKMVPSLRVIGEGKTEPVNTFSDRVSTLDSIAIPLKPNDNTTQFSFIINSTDSDNGQETGTIDSLIFEYTTKEIFKSRACGFVVNYDELTANFSTTAENWIQRIEIIKPSIKLEEEVTAHVKIFH